MRKANAMIAIGMLAAVMGASGPLMPSNEPSNATAPVLPTPEHGAPNSNPAKRARKKALKAKRKGQRRQR